jgi:hypothetical protein
LALFTALAPATKKHYLIDFSKIQLAKKADRDQLIAQSLKGIRPIPIINWIYKAPAPLVLAMMNCQVSFTSSASLPIHHCPFSVLHK